jgi:hypothetical protein
LNKKRLYIQSSMYAEVDIGGKPRCSEQHVADVDGFTEFNDALTSFVDTTNIPNSSQIGKGMMLTQKPVGRNGMRGCRSTTG